MIGRLKYDLSRANPDKSPDEQLQIAGGAQARLAKSAKAREVSAVSPRKVRQKAPAKRKPAKKSQGERARLVFAVYLVWKTMARSALCLRPCSRGACGADAGRRWRE